MSGKRQNNQLRLAFSGEGGVKLRRLLAEGPKRSRRSACPKVRLRTMNN
jgi:hypothetical protein